MTSAAVGFGPAARDASELAWTPAWQTLAGLNPGEPVLEVSADRGLRPGHLRDRGIPVECLRPDDRSAAHISGLGHDLVGDRHGRLAAASQGRFQAILVTLDLGGGGSDGWPDPQPDRLLAGLAPSLRPGGVLLVTCPNPLYRLAPLRKYHAQWVGGPAPGTSHDTYPGWNLRSLPARIRQSLVATGLPSPRLWSPVPSARQAKFLIPIEDPELVGFFLDRLAPRPSSRGKRAALAIGRGLAGTAVPSRLAPTIEAVTHRPAPGRTRVADLAVRLRRLLEPMGVHHPRFVLRNGGDGPTDTRQAFVWDRGSDPRWLIKIGRNDRAGGILAAERARLQELQAWLPPARRGTVPSVVAFVQDDELTFLIESFLPGRRLKDLPPAPTMDSQRQTDLVDWLIDFSRSAPTPADPEATLGACLDRPVQAYLERFATDPEERRVLESLPRSVRTSLSRRPCLVPAHGDLSDANILIDGDRLAVFDWEQPSAHCLPGADLFHLQLSMVATRHGLGRRAAFEAAFVAAFVGDGDAARVHRQQWRRYAAGIGLDPRAAGPLFLAAWVGFAVRKLNYLEQSPSYGQPSEYWIEPQRDWPLLFFADHRCLNVSIAIRHREEFAP